MTLRLGEVRRRVGRWEQELRDRYAGELELDTPTYLIVDPSNARAGRVVRLFRSSDGVTEPKVVHVRRARDALSVSEGDVWLGLLYVEPFATGAAELAGRLLYRFPQVTLACYGRSMPEPGAHGVAGVDYVLGCDELAEYVPALARSVALWRRGLLDRLVHGELCRRVTAHYGVDVARKLGLTPLHEEVRPLDEDRRSSLARAMTLSGGNKTKAAQYLGVSRQTVMRWLKEGRDGLDA